MNHADLHRALLELGERGTPIGAEAAVERAMAEARAARVRHRLVVVMSSAVALVLLVVGVAGGAYLRREYDRVPRVALSGGLSPVEPGADAPTTVLVVGTDGTRADAVMLVRVDPARRAAALSLPRDLVTEPGHGYEQRIALALAGGPERLLEAVRRATGIVPDHYAQVDFAGFRRLVDAVGGVPVHFPTPVRDSITGFDVPRGGCTVLDGAAALALVRSRHLQQRTAEGRWVTDPTGDLGRVARQHDFVLRAFAAVTRKAAQDPRALDRVLDAAADTLVLDDRLSLGELMRLGRRLGDAGTLEMLTLPTQPAAVDGAAVLVVDGTEASGTVERFTRGGESGPSAPAAPIGC